MDCILKDMNIVIGDLHHSKSISENFDKLREELLLMLALDKYIDKKKDEMNMMLSRKKELKLKHLEGYTQVSQ
eukprot:CAMPEP_0116877378 /NCGR_PEP_ID=MMETSP0463-20121206/9164_1 /TAXON_ID=181622 /ORGANISM="Strombidinopsis sp, Strain SopsisLIS2011" /LENGTH=72 /DNA_ID=CAMNT_0004524611 /DNA_START=1068 /DNA_END=1286 /DNA_ORIENTATION=+